MSNQIIMTSISIEDLSNIINVAVEKAILKLKEPADQPTEESTNDFISLEAVAKLLRVSKVTLHAYKKAGLIPFHRLGRRVLFRKSEVLNCLKTINKEIIK